MATHLPTAMPRLRVSYQVGVRSHHTMFHFAFGTDASTAQSYGQSVCNALKAIMFSPVVFNGADYAPAGSNVFNPVSWANISGLITAASINEDLAAREFSLVGRTSSGCRTRLFLYGVGLGDSGVQNWRITTAESSILATLVTWLNSVSNPLVGLDGFSAIWKSYANYGYNDYYVKKIRRGG